MTRIIAGFAGSLRLAVPGSGTRPTSDRVREAIFSALDARDAITGMRCLDLYAGSGALGLEAASRGAAHVTLVDSRIAVAKQNAALILAKAPPGGKPVIETSGQAVQPFLEGARAFWELVFLDPPYEFGSAEIEQNLAALVPRLSPDAVVVLERGARSPEPAWPGGLELDRRKDYGDTALFWLSTAPSLSLTPVPSPIPTDSGDS
ncbi:MAG: 16S rRNA (guanine(966)-N(2))-methyltransferase RsmD [Rhodoglobus sp.]